jgi:hypothetical protein
MDELESLRAVVRALLAERMAESEWKRAVWHDGRNPTTEDMELASPLHRAFRRCREETDRLLCRVTEPDPSA